MKSCIGWEDGLDEIVRHAKHAEKVLNQAAEKAEIKRQKKNDDAQLTLLKTVAEMAGRVAGDPRGRGRGRGRGR